jgi:hypothetical protein
VAISGYREWYFQLFNMRTRSFVADSTGVCNVLTDGSPVEITLYADQAGTAAANPITFTNGVIRFFTADSVSALDLSILTANSHAVFAESVVESVHRIDINPDLMCQKLVIPYSVVGLSELVFDTGFPINANMLIKDIEVDVFTAMTGGVLTVGTSTATTGFCSGISAATTGFPITLLEEALVSTSAVFGTLLALATGSNVRKKHVRANATSGAKVVLSNTTSSSTAGNGYVYLLFDRLPSRG